MTQNAFFGIWRQWAMSRAEKERQVMVSRQEVRMKICLGVDEPCQHQGFDSVGQSLIASRFPSSVKISLIGMTEL